MNFSGFGQGANAGIQGADAMTRAQTNGLTLQDAQRQAQAQAALVKILQSLGSQQQPQQGQPNPLAGIMPAATPQVPGPPPPGGVSPPMGGMPPAGGAPVGGAGPMPPVGAGAPPSLPPGAGMPPGMDYGRLASSIQGSGLNSGAQGAALQMLMKLMQPQQNNALKLDLANLNAGVRERGQDIGVDTADKNRDAKKEIADANNKFKSPPSQKPLNDPKFRKLEMTYNNAVKVYNASPTQDNFDAQTAAAKAYNDYSPGDASTASSTTPTGGRITITDDKGKDFTVPADQLQDAIAQGYKQK